LVLNDGVDFDFEAFRRNLDNERMIPSVGTPLYVVQERWELFSFFWTRNENSPTNRKREKRKPTNE
jgi:hypothetical protein